jgi:hypothetical protein
MASTAKEDEWDSVLNLEQKAYQEGVESGMEDAQEAQAEGLQSGYYKKSCVLCFTF